MSERKEIVYEIPPGTPVVACKGCGAAIQFVETANGKQMPVNHDGTPHWSTCPQAKRFRK